MNKTFMLLVGILQLFCFAQIGCSQQEELRLWDVAAGERVTLGQILGTLGASDLVYVGEMHDRPDHHAAQLEVIRSLHRRNGGVAVGLEMMQHRDQKALDRWVAGELSEEEFQRIFARNWGMMWPLYRDIFLYCRDNAIPMVGLNVPREITRQVARQGFESLTREQMAELPIVTCEVGPEYEEFLRRVLGSHGGGESFRRFCEAQLVWDTSMAVYALEYLKDNPGRTMVVLCGTVHAWKMAVPRQVERMNDRVGQQVIVPSVPGEQGKDAITVDDCDYLIVEEDG
ncbi:MAG: ChaN family lipoprotein [Desulfovibrionales bacterium]